MKNLKIIVTQYEDGILIDDTEGTRIGAIFYNIDNKTLDLSIDKEKIILIERKDKSLCENSKNS